MPKPATPAAAAFDVRSDIGWPNAATGQQRGAFGIAVPASDAVPNVQLLEGEPGSEQVRADALDGCRCVGFGGTRSGGRGAAVVGPGGGGGVVNTS